LRSFDAHAEIFASKWSGGVEDGIEAAPIVELHVHFLAASPHVLDELQEGFPVNFAILLRQTSNELGQHVLDTHCCECWLGQTSIHSLSKKNVFFERAPWERGKQQVPALSTSRLQISLLQTTQKLFFLHLGLVAI